MKTPESYEKRDIKKYLDDGVPVLWYFMPLMAGFGKSGVSDIVGCMRFKGFFAIEVKRPGKEPTPIQWRRMREIEMPVRKSLRPPLRGRERSEA